MDTTSTPKQTNRLAVSSLLSPPEMKRSDSFSSAMAPTMVRTPFSSFTSDNILQPGHATPARGQRKEGLPPSPPISPEVAMVDDNMSDCAVTEGTIRDPQLFTSGVPGIAVAPSFPLFPPQERTNPVDENAISQHIEESTPKFKDVCEPPSREDYRLTFTFMSRIGELYNENPRKYAQTLRDESRMYASPFPNSKRSPLRKIAPKPANAPRRTAAVVPRIPRPQRVQKTTPRTRVHDSFDLETPPSVSPAPKQPRLPSARDDVDYQSLPDFAPPISTLPKGNNKILKADWKGAPLDLSQDPDRDQLHEAEVNLAATLRLSCATYLCSKRRIFIARIEAMKIGKEFRKTDAQQACKIDVNKASKLWTAYEKVGWFKPEYFRHHFQ